jgi:meiotically up-regulated gene 157 (Mug157) protein
MRVFNKKYVLDCLRYYQKRNYIAYRSHRKGKQEAEKARL